MCMLIPSRRFVMVWTGHHAGGKAETPHSFAYGECVVDSRLAEAVVKPLMRGVSTVSSAS